MAGANHTLSKNRMRVATLIMSMATSVCAHAVVAQDLQYSGASELIYPPLEKIILPLESITIKMSDDRKFLYLEETQELDRLVTHMRVKKDMRVKITAFGEEKNLKLAKARNNIIRGYLVDNGVDLRRITFLATTGASGTVRIHSINET